MRISNSVTPVKYNKINNFPKTNYQNYNDKEQTQVTFSGFSFLKQIKRILEKEAVREQTIKQVKQMVKILKARHNPHDFDTMMCKQDTVSEELLKSISSLDVKHCGVLKPILACKENFANSSTVSELKNHILKTFGEKMSAAQLSKLVVPMVKNPENNYVFTTVKAIELLVNSKNSFRFKPVIIDALKEHAKYLPFLPIQKEKIFLTSLLNAMRTVGTTSDKEILMPFLNHSDTKIKSLTQNVINSLSEKSFPV